MACEAYGHTGAWIVWLLSVHARSHGGVLVLEVLCGHVDGDVETSNRAKHV